MLLKLHSSPDLAEIVLRVRETMADGFYEYAPSGSQQETLDQLEKIACDIQTFNKR